MVILLVCDYFSGELHCCELIYLTLSLVNPGKTSKPKSLNCTHYMSAFAQDIEENEK